MPAPPARHAYTIGIALLCFLPFAILVTRWVQTQQPMIWYDEFGYAEASARLSAAWTELFHPPEAAPGLLERLWHAVFHSCKAPRPAFHLPADFVVGVFALEWSVDRVVLFDLWLYGALLFASIAGVLARLRPGSHVAVLAGCSTLLCASTLWQYSGLLMGELPVTAAIALVAYLALRVIQEDRPRDHFFLGLAVSWGLFTKPVFGFFVAPLLLWVLARFLSRHRPWRRETRRAALGRAALALSLPVLTGIALYKRLVGSSEQIRIMNEELQVYGQPSSFAENLGYPLQLLTEFFPLVVLLALVPLWLASLRSRAGRACLLALLPLLAFVCFGLSLRNARVFHAFLVGFAVLSGLSLAALPRRMHIASALVLALLAGATCLAHATGPSWLRDRALARTGLQLAQDKAGRLELRRHDFDAPLPRVQDQYADYHVDEVLAATGVELHPDRRVFVAFSGSPLCASAYEGRLLMRRGRAARPHQFVQTGFRRGGWGLPGGLAPGFLDSAYVLTRTRPEGTGQGRSELYARLFCEQLPEPSSPLRAGLVLRAEYPLPEGDRLRVLERTRPPSPEEWLAILALLYERDRDNPWNARCIVRALGYGEEHSLPELTLFAASWILGFAEDPLTSPAFAERYSWARHFPELRDQYEEAWQRARAAAERLQDSR